MSTQTQLEAIRRQSMRYKFEDGFEEMALGSIFIATTIFLGIISSVDKSYAWLVAIGAVILVAGIGFGLNRMICRLKENITYPRTGYVEVNDPKANWIIYLSLGLATALIGLAWLLRDNPDVLAIFNGLVLAAVAGFLGLQHNVKRLYGVAIIALILGVGFAFSGLSTDITYAGPYAGTGLALVISGALTLRHYLQSHAIED